jgi:hypothetical protein
MIGNGSPLVFGIEGAELIEITVVKGFNVTAGSAIAGTFGVEAIGNINWDNVNSNRGGSTVYDPQMERYLQRSISNGIWLPPIYISGYDGTPGSGSVDWPLWWGRTDWFLNPILYDHHFGDSYQIIWGSLALPFAVIGAGEMLGAAAARQIGIELWRYPNAGGRGLNFLKDGKSVMRFDWHKFKLNGRMVNRPHIDIPKWKIHHWPWK